MYYSILSKLYQHVHKWFYKLNQSDLNNKNDACFMVPDQGFVVRMTAVPYFMEQTCLKYNIRTEKIYFSRLCILAMYIAKYCVIVNIKL